MKHNRDTSAVQAAAQAAPAPEAPASGGEEARPFGALVNELTELVRSGALPEGFDLAEACSDAAFLELTEELPLAAAIRVYAAERRAARADEGARERLAAKLRSRSALPQPVRGASGASVERDYAGMSDEEFRALEQQYRSAAQRGIRVRL